MKNQKIRQKSTSDKKYVEFLHKHGIKPLDTYEKHEIKFYVFDYRETQLLKIAYRALSE